MLEEEKLIWNGSCSVVSLVVVFFFFLPGLTKGNNGIRTTSSYPCCWRRKNNIFFLQVKILALVTIAVMHPSWEAQQGQSQPVPGSRGAAGPTSAFQTWQAWPREAVPHGHSVWSAAQPACLPGPQATEAPLDGKWVGHKCWLSTTIGEIQHQSK